MKCLIDVKVENDHVIFTRKNSLIEQFSLSQLDEAIHVLFGSDLMGPAPNSFWIFNLQKDAVVMPDRINGLWSSLVKLLESHPTIRRTEASCDYPPSAWCKRFLGFLPLLTVDPRRITKQEMAEALGTFKNSHSVTEFLLWI
jgi:hypothetical protein